MARIFRNISDQIGTPQTIKIPCELHVPVGHTSLPIELGGLVVTPDGEMRIAAAIAARILEVHNTSDFGDEIPPPPPIEGRRSVYFLCVDGQVLATHQLRFDAAAAETTLGGRRVWQYAVTNLTTSASINLWSMASVSTGVVMTAHALAGGSLVIGGTTYRKIVASPNPGFEDRVTIPGH